MDVLLSITYHHFLKSVSIFINDPIEIVLYANPICKHEKKKKIRPKALVFFVKRSRGS